ncbi:MAG: diacylglycerol kinase family protein [Clostridia bacterium]|nr:diacylglycerol kinase family protein [Clostridia bacterium]
MNIKNKSFLTSLYHAMQGFWDALRSERNLRVHFCIGNLICFFAAFYGISRTEWAVLLLTVGFVISAELLNSAVEMAVDTATREIRTDAMHAKDFAAAATLVSAIFSVAVGIALFGNITKIINALTGIFTSVHGIAILAMLAIVDLRVLLMKK